MVLVAERTWTDSRFPEVAVAKYKDSGTVPEAVKRLSVTLHEIFDTIIYAESKGGTLAAQAEIFCNVLTCQLKGVPVESNKRKTVYKRARDRYLQRDKGHQVKKGCYVFERKQAVKSGELHGDMQDESHYNLRQKLLQKFSANEDNKTVRL